MNLKQYLFLYDVLQKLIQEQLIERGGQVIGRWPIYELYNKVQEQLVEGDTGFSIREICQFFDVVLQHNKDLLIRMVNDAKLNLNELKQELESIELKSDKDTPLEEHELEATIIPTPEESVVDEILNTLFDTTAPTEPEPIVVEELEDIPIPQPIKEVEVKMTKEVDQQLLQLDAQFAILQDKLFIHPKFMESVKDLPERIMTLFLEHGELTVKEVVTHLQIDASIRGVRIAFVVAWKQCADQLIDAESLL